MLRVLDERKRPVIAVSRLAQEASAQLKGPAGRREEGGVATGQSPVAGRAGEVGVSLDAGETSAGQGRGQAETCDRRPEDRERGWPRPPANKLDVAGDGRGRTLGEVASRERGHPGDSGPGPNRLESVGSTTTIRPYGSTASWPCAVELERMNAAQSDTDRRMRGNMGGYSRVQGFSGQAFPPDLRRSIQRVFAVLGDGVLAVGGAIWRTHRPPPCPSGSTLNTSPVWVSTRRVFSKLSW